MATKRTSSQALENAKEALEASKEADLQEAEDEKAYAKEAGAKEAGDTGSSSEDEAPVKFAVKSAVKFADDDLKYRPGEPLCYILNVNYFRNNHARIPMRCLTEETLQRLKEWNALKHSDFKYGMAQPKPIKRRKETEEKFKKRVKAYKLSKRVAELNVIVEFLESACETITYLDFVGHHDVHLVVDARCWIADF